MSPHQSQVQLDESLIIALPIIEAFDVEIKTPPDLLPSRVVEPALNGHGAAYRNQLVGSLRSGIAVSIPDVIRARKTRGGSRPVPVLSFDERVLLRALGLHIASRLPADALSVCTHEQMVQGPLEHQANWVVHADVAAFYTFVDHDLLASEIVALTGDAVAALAVADLLHRVMGRRFGLPQGHRSSDIFADIYIDRVEREMIRSGRSIWRYNDDFRICATDSVDAERCIEALDIELRRVGLALNDDKTFSHSGPAYREWIAKAEEQVETLARDVGHELANWNPYTEEMIEPDDAEVQPEAAVRALALWESTSKASDAGSIRLANRRVLQIALSLLKHYASPDGLDYCTRLLKLEPQLTSQVAAYIGTVAGPQPSEACDTLDAIIRDPDVYLNDWQMLWLLEAARDSSELGPSTTDWIRFTYDRPAIPDVVCASAGSILGTQGLVENNELLELCSRLSFAAQAEVVALLGHRSPTLTNGQRRSVRDEFVRRTIFDYYAPKEATSGFDPSLEPF